ncbi:hypothetical protein PHJA_001429000 [Phtheirospermum japonicum]|uniref:S-protein homolog n=1 Tax=Phtheirospermum japonicum TaxID=374723 RepID=A0A830BXK1_9LAMI|nr:hypothetical protein PHJA_001429000 [Phtheirospermum japonicum]
MFLLLLSPYLVLETKAGLYGKHEVNIISDLPENSSKLIAHCKSKDDDLGTRELSRGQSFGWKFRGNILSTTRFYCYFYWGSLNQTMDVFFAGWDLAHFHHTYSYVLRPEGVFLSNDAEDHIMGSTLFYCYFWWGSKNKSMDVFSGRWDEKSYYHTYSYVLNDDGVYLSNDEKNHTGSLGLISLW